MHRATWFLAAAVALRLAPICSAALVVNPPRPITHQVSVQMIQTALDNGSSPAPLLGDPTREAAIKAAIDSIWSQAGIDINFLPNVVRYNNTFANRGLGVGVRPISDLGSILTSAGAQGGILHPDPSVINMFFVNVVPGFDAKNSYWANGVGNIGVNGIAMYVGTSVSAEHAAHWMAHEIGHNLGLLHLSSGSPNLMTSSRNTEYLNSEQINAVFSTNWNNPVAYIPLGGTGFPQPMYGSMPGDYDGNGLVDAADYALWRKSLYSTSNLAADGNGNGIVDHGDLSVWRSHFGQGFAAHLGHGTVFPTDFDGGGEPEFAGQEGIPEPGTPLLILIGTMLCMAARRRLG